MKLMFLFLLVAAIVMLPIATATAQTSTVKLPTGANTSDFTVTDNSNNVLMKLFGDGGFYLLGNASVGTIPLTGAGARVMWYPKKGAFRAGYVFGTEWDDVNTGLYSIALGSGTQAIGYASTAMGFRTKASEIYSTATGYYTEASGQYSTAMGNGTVASGVFSTAMGVNTAANGASSTAMGGGTVASGAYSAAMGANTTASGDYSTAMGSYVTTAGMSGAFIIGDHSAPVLTSSAADNMITMRFAGGYRLYSNSAMTTGVYMSGGLSGWNNYSDRNKKENFHPIDGEQLLAKIRQLPITEWNYKGTDASVKYIGPVAQDFYATFHLGGKDSLGINSICIDGVNMAAIQALEKRTSELKKAQQEIVGLTQSAIERDRAQQQVNDQLRAELQQLRQTVKEVAQRLTVTSPTAGATNISEISK